MIRCSALYLDAKTELAINKIIVLCLKNIETLKGIGSFHQHDIVTQCVQLFYKSFTYCEYMNRANKMHVRLQSWYPPSPLRLLNLRGWEHCLAIIVKMKTLLFTSLTNNSDLTRVQDFVCLFVCLGFFVQLGNFSLIRRRYHCQWRAENFDQLVAIEQWGFFSVPHLLWHGASVYMYNGHLRGPVTLAPIAERLAVELSLPVFTI